jgi:predicted SAM-dependent methyltransferase
MFGIHLGLQRRLWSALRRRRILSPRTISGLQFDLLRLRARWRRRGLRGPWPDRLHLGCGGRHVAGWLNADVAYSDCDVDMVSRLPWPDGTFSAVVSQHVIEHFEMDELLGLLCEIRRVLRKDGEAWLSCPDMAKTCAAYMEDRGAIWMARHRARTRRTDLPPDMPPQQIINERFHQGGEHKNLYDGELLGWMLRRAGFSGYEGVEEAALLRRFPDFPPRGDDINSLYVVARP